MRAEETIVRRYGVRAEGETDDACAQRIADHHFADGFRCARVARDDNGRVHVDVVVWLVSGRYAIQRDPPGSASARLLPLRSDVAMAAYAAEVDADGRPCEEGVGATSD